MADYRAISGARAVLKIDNQEVGWATGIQGAETIEVVPIAVLGKLDIQEHEIVGRTCTFSASFVRIVNLPMSKFPAGQGGTGSFPTSDSDGLQELKDIINLTKFEVSVFDQVGDGSDGVALYTFENCMITSRAFTVDRGGVIALNATFVSRRMRDQAQ